jgi:glucosylceramidase
VPLTSQAAADALGLPLGTMVCDITILSPVPAAGGTPIVVGPAGKSIDALAVTGNSLVATMSDGTTKSTALPAVMVDSQAFVSAAIESARPRDIVTAKPYLTTPDQAHLLEAQTPVTFGKIVGVGKTQIVVSPDNRAQEILGFGAALTDSSAYLLMQMAPADRDALLRELYAPDQCAWSTVRIAVGVSDFMANVGGSIEGGYTYDDQPTGVDDPNLLGFGIVRDNQYLIPLLKQIMAINPRVRVIASVWSPPKWMKTVDYFYGPTAGPAATTTIKGSRINNFAEYLVKYVQAMAALGIPIWMLSPQNEPDAPTASWTYYTDVDYQFLAKSCHDKFTAAGINPDILFFHDNHVSKFASIQTLLSSVEGPWIKHIGWHGYGGSIYKVEETWRAYPSKLHHMTEYRSLLSQDWPTTMGIMAGGTVIAHLRHRVSSITLWNMALDETGGPVTLATGRRGVVTINSTTHQASRFADYYALAHMSRFAKPGALVCDSTSPGLNTNTTGLTIPGVQTVAAVNPDESVVLYAYNPAATAEAVQVVDARTQLGFNTTIPAGALMTFVWSGDRQPAGAINLAPAVPAAPTLTGTSTVPGTAHLSWTPVTGAATYMVTKDGADLGMVPATQTTWDELDATSHVYRVRASGAWGDTAASNAQTVAPAAPTAPTTPVLSGTATPDSASLTWPAISDNGSKITTIEVRRSTTSGTEVTIATLPRGATSYSDITTTASTTYYYTVRATNSVGSVTSNEISVSTVAARPALSSVAGSSGTGTNTLNYTHTGAVAGSNQALILDITWTVTAGSTANPPTMASKILLGGTAMAAVGSSYTVNGSRATARFIRLNPGTGSLAVSIDIGTGYTGGITAVSSVWNNVNQTTPLTNGAVASSATGNGNDRDHARERGSLVGRTGDLWRPSQHHGPGRQHRNRHGRRRAPDGQHYPARRDLIAAGRGWCPGHGRVHRRSLGQLGSQGRRDPGWLTEQPVPPHRTPPPLRSRSGVGAVSAFRRPRQGSNLRRSA